MGLPEDEAGWEVAKAWAWKEEGAAEATWAEPKAEAEVDLEEVETAFLP